MAAVGLCLANQASTRSQRQNTMHTPSSATAHPCEPRGSRRQLRLSWRPPQATRSRLNTPGSETPRTAKRPNVTPAPLAGRRPTADVPDPAVYSRHKGKLRTALSGSSKEKSQTTRRRDLEVAQNSANASATRVRRHGCWPDRDERVVADALARSTPRQAGMRSRATRASFALRTRSAA
jgi:hypothetical protein